MAVIRNTAAMQYRGKVGNTTYYVEGGRQLARVSQNSSNYGETASRSESQQFQRGKWGNLVNFYKVSKGWMRKAYETKKRTQSDYNRFMQLNTPNAKIYLTKNMYANGGCVVDAFRISEGSLRPIQVVETGNVYKTDLALGSLTIGPTTTIEELTAALLANNSHLRNNMQISYISYQQDIAATGTPSVICTAYELTLDVTSTELVRSYLPEFCSSVVDGYLGTSNRISTGAFAYVLSETVNGTTKVSTQVLTTKNTSLINQYSTQAAIAASIASYGVDEDIFLTSGSRPTDATPQPVYLESIRVEETDVEQMFKFGSKGPNIGDLFSEGGYVNIVVSGAFASATNVTFHIVGSENVESVSIVGKYGNKIRISELPEGTWDEQIQKVSVTIDGNLIEGYFTEN